MLKYIEKIEGHSIGVTSAEKCFALKRAGAILMDTPTKFEEDLVCVINNTDIGIALVVPSIAMLEILKDPQDSRIKHWFKFTNALKHV